MNFLNPPLSTAIQLQVILWLNCLILRKKVFSFSFHALRYFLAMISYSSFLLILPVIFLVCINFKTTFHSNPLFWELLYGFNFLAKRKEVYISLNFQNLYFYGWREEFFSDLIQLLAAFCTGSELTLALSHSRSKLFFLFFFKGPEFLLNFVHYF